MINEKMCRRYCYEDLSMIENFYMAVSSPERWDCHHRVETIMNCGRKELIAQDCYYHRPAHELVFLSRGEHLSLHHAGKTMTKEARRKMSLAALGNKRCVGRKMPGYAWWTDGTVEKRLKECPGEGWRRGRLAV